MTGKLDEIGRFVGEFQESFRTDELTPLRLKPIDR
jgi:hypothetical protein